MKFVYWKSVSQTKLILFIGEEHDQFIEDNIIHSRSESTHTSYINMNLFIENVRSRISINFIHYINVFRETKLNLFNGKTPSGN